MRKFRPDEENNIQILTSNSVEITAIEPTSNGLSKSIMDATGSVRNYLLEKGVHDYSMQKQGPECKSLIDAVLLYPDKSKLSVASLYRPVTKKGDPRIWFKGLTEYAVGGDILALIAFENRLFVLNITKFDIKYTLEHFPKGPISELIAEIRTKSNQASEELLALLRVISKTGPIKGLLNADTSIGRTLEHLLGIDINSSKQPDYKGIEIKSNRDKKSNRKTLFAQVPDWSISKFKSSKEILDAFGYDRGEDLKLYCTVSAFTKNSQGLQLKVDQVKNLLTENSDVMSIGDFVHWPLALLHSRLLEKHNETFWISAISSRDAVGNEHFLFNKVEHTKKPITSQFDLLLDQGIITVDHLIKRSSSGKVVEKGPLFKIRPQSLNLLFPPSQIYKLV